MINVHYLTFNGFQENTYILFDETKECVIIDPGCYSSEEQNELKACAPISESSSKSRKKMNIIKTSFVDSRVRSTTISTN